ncbi:MAG: hypothetical protein ACI8VT_004396 [Saprospiraceae bacterium]|jgi:hypothetical protein
METNSDLEVMGHTHFLRKGLKGGVVDYINTGFECVPIPGMEEKHKKMTFGVVNVENSKYVNAEVMAVIRTGNTFEIKNDNPPAAEIFVELAGDFSCHITVVNESDEDYVLDSKDN